MHFYEELLIIFFCIVFKCRPSGPILPPPRSVIFYNNFCDFILSLSFLFYFLIMFYHENNFVYLICRCVLNFTPVKCQL